MEVFLTLMLVTQWGLIQAPDEYQPRLGETCDQAYGRMLDDGHNYASDWGCNVGRFQHRTSLPLRK